MYELEDGIENRFSGMENLADIEAELDSLKEEIQNLLDETQERLDNMPEQLQNSDSGNTLQERIDGLENWISELEYVDCEIDEYSIREECQDDLEEGDDLEENVKERIQERIDEIVLEIEGLSSGL